MNFKPKIDDLDNFECDFYNFIDDFTNFSIKRGFSKKYYYKSRKSLDEFGLYLNRSRLYNIIRY